MPNWKLSRYTVIFRTEKGEAILHNSFMGAIACIPSKKFSEIEGLLYQEFPEEHLDNDSLKDLCDNGFFFPSHIDEQKFVDQVLQRESNSGNFDLILLPHENCNFRCSYCYESHKGGAMEPSVIQGLKNLVRNKASQCRSLDVRWFGGEPLLALNIIDELSNSFMESCDHNGIDYRSQITTNGYLLTPKVLDFLLKRKVKYFQITLDGPPKIHDRCRKLAGGGETFARIFENLLAMQKTEADFSVSVRVNFTEESLPEMQEFFSMMSENIGGDPRFGLYFRPVGKYGGPNDDEIKVCEPSYARLIEMDLSQQYLEMGYLDSVLRKSLQSHGQVCYASRESSLVVGADGKLYKCSVAFEDPENHVGYLMENGDLQINEERFALWVSKKEADKCVSCPVVPLCQGKYCPRYAIREGKPVCPMLPEVYARMVSLVAGNDIRLL